MGTKFWLKLKGVKKQMIRYYIFP